MIGWLSKKLIKLPIPTANLTDFPVCVKIVADADIGAHCLATGYDIRFTTADETTLLPYERESWAGGDGSDVTAIFWVKTNVATAGTSLWIYWGNSAAGDVSEVVRDTEFVVNGGFDSDTTDWIPDSCTIASVGGGQKGNCLEITRVSATMQAAYRTVPGLTIGLTYRFSVFLKNGTSGDAEHAMFFVYRAPSWDDTYIAENAYSSGAWTKYLFTFIPTGTSCFPVLYKHTETPGTMLFDTVSIKLFHSAAWSAYEDAQELLADGGLTWGAEETVANAGAGLVYVVKVAGEITSNPIHVRAIQIIPWAVGGTATFTYNDGSAKTAFIGATDGGQLSDGFYFFDDSEDGSGALMFPNLTLSAATNAWAIVYST